MRRLFTCGLSVLLCSTPAFGGEMGVEVNVLIPPLQRLEAAPAVLSLPAASPLDLSAGFMELGEPIHLTVFSNSPWELSIRQPGASSGGMQYDTPPLQWRSGDTQYADVPAEWTRIASGAAPASGQPVVFHLRILLDWNSGRPGVYEPRVEYRLAPTGN